MQKLLASFVISLCVYSAAGKPPPAAGPLEVRSGSYKLPKGYRCGKSAATKIWYPKDFANGPFPIASYGHGAGGGMLWDLSKSIASLGFVVVAPATKPCHYSHYDILGAIEWSRSNSTLHPALAHVDWSRAGVFGHSFGGHRALWAAIKAQMDPDRFNVKAVVASHGFSQAEKVTMPMMFISGSSDRRAQRDASCWFRSPAAYKIYAAVRGGKHMEPNLGGRLNPFAAHFLGCHVADLQKSCAMVYGDGPDTVCRANQMSNCEVVMPLTTFTGSTTTTTYTGTTTTITTTTTPCHDCITLRGVGGRGCLKSKGGNQLLEKGATSDCARFRNEGTLFHSVDVPSQCLDYFSGSGFGLWSCHGQHNQQWHRQGSKWCVDANCVVVSEPATTITTTTASPVASSTSTTSPYTPATTMTSTSASPAKTSTSTTLPGEPVTTITTTTASPVVTSTSTTVPAPGKSVQSGDTIFLKTHSGNGHYVDVEGVSVHSRWESQGTWQALKIEKENSGAVHSGDVVYLKAHTGNHIDVVDGVVRARWQDTGAWQAMTIQKTIGSGPILSGDILCLKAHTGKFLDVQNGTVRARWNECREWQAMSIQKEVVGALFSGESIHLRAHTGNQIDVEGNFVRARWTEKGLWQTFTIQNYGGRAIFSGDAVFLKAHTGALVHVQDAAVRAEWYEYGLWQTFIIKRKSGDGPVMPGDSIFLRAHTGKFVEVDGVAVQARWYEAGEWQSLVVEKSSLRRLAESSQQKEVTQLTKEQEDHSNFFFV